MYYFIWIQINTFWGLYMYYFIWIQISVYIKSVFPFQNWPLRVEKTWPWGCHFVPSSVYQWHRTRPACVAKVSSPSGAKLFCGSLGNRQGNIAAPWRVQTESKKLLLLFLYKCCQYLNKNHNFLLGNELRKVPCMDNIYTCIINIVHTYTTVVLFLLQIWAFQGATMQKSNNKNKKICKYSICMLPFSFINNIQLMSSVWFPFNHSGSHLSWLPWKSNGNNPKRGMDLGQGHFHGNMKRGYTGLKKIISMEIWREATGQKKSFPWKYKGRLLI